MVIKKEYFINHLVMDKWHVYNYYSSHFIAWREGRKLAKEIGEENVKFYSRITSEESLGPDFEEPC